MKDWQTYFKGKRVTVMGLGLLGRGVGDVKFLAEAGAADIIVTDMKGAEELEPSLRELRQFGNISFSLGGHELEDFRDRDLVIKAAGVPDDSPFLAEARRNAIPVEMSTALFASFAPGMVVGVTGTRGKSTTTHLLHEILEKAFDGKKRVFLGGNVKGVSTLAFLAEMKEGDIAVLELDSWQLQGFGNLRLSPHISVFTTFLPDHLNYYKGDLNAYLDDKANIFKYQTDVDFLIIGRQAAELVKEKYGSAIKSTVYEAGDEDVPSDWKITMPGRHNRYNVALALKAAQILRVGTETVREVAEAFRGVPGRLELVRELGGVRIYNDTTATTPDATIAGLHALFTPMPGSGIKPSTVLVLGGADKNLDMTRLLKEIPVHAKAAVLLAGTGSSRIEADFMRLAEEGLHLEKAATLEEAVSKAFALSRKGDSLLFSPAFASFGMFKNEFDRGDKFVEVVGKLS